MALRSSRLVSEYYLSFKQIKYLLNSRNYCLGKLSILANPLDNFTTQLIENKLDKWGKQLKRNSDNVIVQSEIKLKRHKLGIGTLCLEEIDNLFQEAEQLEDNDTIIELTEQCVYFKILPSVFHILSALTVCAQKGNKQLIIQIEDLCRENHQQLLKEHSNFKHYVAEAIWIKGNINESLKLFGEVYDDDCFLRRRIKLTLRLLIIDAIKKRSEAVLINITKFAILLSLKYDDFFLLGNIWQGCILSEWFTDQNFALDLMATNKRLREAVVNKIQYVVIISLYNHRTEVIYRLLEVLLKNEMKLSYSGVLMALLNYQICQGNIKKCMEIIQWCLQNEVHISSGILSKFIILLVSYESDVKDVKPKKTINVNSYKF